MLTNKAAVLAVFAVNRVYLRQLNELNKLCCLDMHDVIDRWNYIETYLQTYYCYF